MKTIEFYLKKSAAYIGKMRWRKGYHCLELTAEQNFNAKAAVYENYAKYLFATYVNRDEPAFRVVGSKGIYFTQKVMEQCRDAQKLADESAKGESGGRPELSENLITSKLLQA